MLRASADIAASATRTLHVDTFRPTRADNLDAIAAAHDRGVDVHLLLDSDAIAGSAPQLARLGTLVEYGSDPYKQHGKAISRDGAEALVASDVSDAKSAARLEFGIHFTGAPVAALEAIQRINPTDDPAGASAAYDAARAVGILANDPHHDRRDVSRAARTLIDGATRDLTVATKLFDSPDTSRELASAAERGAHVTVFTHELPAKQQARMQRAGVDVRLLDHDVAEQHGAALHGTIVASDGQALLTSMPLLDRAIDGSSGRQSRELGVVVDGDAARSLLGQVRPPLDSTPHD